MLAVLVLGVLFAASLAAAVLYARGRVQRHHLGFEVRLQQFAAMEIGRARAAVPQVEFAEAKL